MKFQFGFLLQFAVLVFLPLACLWQLSFGMPIIYLPMFLLAGVVLFSFGTRLRESK